MENLEIASATIKELEAEYTSTKKCLERIPETLFEFKPHPTLMNLGYLSLLVAEIPLWITLMLEDGEVDFATYAHFQPKTTKELVDHFKENFQGAVDGLKNINEGDLEGNFYLKNNGQELYKISKKENLMQTINHWVHHRGQLTVYMRMNEIPVPSIYGPSADDKNY